MVFYYRYLTDKYFTRLKHARFIIAAYDIKVEHVKEVRRKGLLKVCLRFWHEHVEDTRREDAAIEQQADLLAVKLFFFRPLLARQEQNRKLLMAVAWYKASMLKTSLKTWASYTTELYHMRKKDIIAQRHFERSAKETSFSILKNLKQIVASFDREQDKKADRFIDRWNKKKLRVCFDAMQSNEDERIVRSRRQLKKQLMRRIVACWKQWINTIRLADALQLRRKRHFAKQLLLALKTHKDQQQRFASNAAFISQQCDLRLARRHLRQMFEQSKHRISLNQREALLAQNTERSLMQRTIRDWRLQAAGKLIEKKMATRLLLKQFFGLVRSRGEALRKADEQERLLRRFTFRRQAKFLIFLFKINVEVERTKKENRLLLENKYKSIIFYGWLEQAKLQRQLKHKAAKVQQMDLRLKFRLWRDLTLSKMMLGYWSQNQQSRVFLAWKAAVDSVNEKVIIMRSVVDSNLLSRAFDAVKQHTTDSKEYRYMNIQAVAFERLSAKRKLLNWLVACRGCDDRAIESFEKQTRNKLLSRHLEAWVQLHTHKVEQEELDDRAAAFYSSHRLRNSFDSLRAFMRLEQHHYEQEKDAMNQHKARLKEAIVRETVEQHKEMARQFEIEAEAKLFIKKKRVLNLVKKIGRLWLDKARKRLMLLHRNRRQRETDPWTAIPDHHTSIRLATTDTQLRGYTSNVIEPVKKKEEEMAQYLTYFQKKRRLEPVGLASKPLPRSSQSSVSSSVHPSQPAFYLPTQDNRTANREQLQQALPPDLFQHRPEQPRHHSSANDSFTPQRDLPHQHHRHLQLIAADSHFRPPSNTTHPHERTHSSPLYPTPQPLHHYHSFTPPDNPMNELESLLEEYRLLGSLKHKTLDQQQHIEHLKNKIRHLYLQVK